MVRVALLAAGFYTGSGAGSGPKSETTAAFTSMAVKNTNIRLLGSDWLQRFHRSGSKFGPETSESEKAVIEKRILNHPQFGDSKEVTVHGK